LFIDWLRYQYKKSLLRSTQNNLAGNAQYNLAGYNLWHTRATIDSVKSEIADEFHAILPSVPLSKINSCICVSVHKTMKIGNVSMFGFKEGYIPSKVLKIEIGKKLYFEAKSTLLSESRVMFRY
jgi:hypothetical protein